MPLQGFGSLEGMNGIQKFQIHRDDRSTDRLPCAHTWWVWKDWSMVDSWCNLITFWIWLLHGENCLLLEEICLLLREIWSHFDEICLLLGEIWWLLGENLLPSLGTTANFRGDLIILLELFWSLIGMFRLLQRNIFLGKMWLVNWRSGYSWGRFEQFLERSDDSWETTAYFKGRSHYSPKTEMITSWCVLITSRKMWLLHR